MISREIAALAGAWRTAGEQPDGQICAALAAGFGRLHPAAERAGQARLAELASVAEVMLEAMTQSPEAADPLLWRTVGDYVAAVEGLASGPERPEAGPVAGRRLLLRSPDESAASRLEALLTGLGWSLTRVSDAAGLGQALAAGEPALVVEDIDPPARPAPTPETGLPPRVALATSGAAERRLAAAQAGFEGFWPKHISRACLAAELERLAPPADAAPLRLLLRDDSRTQAAYYRNLLRRSGMEVEVAESAEAVFAALAERPPDLLLLDLHMPGYDGIALTRAVRQLPGGLSLPVVFLSMETDPQRQLDALEAGADDFLVKPVPGTRLRRALAIRARRGRALRLAGGGPPVPGCG